MRTISGPALLTKASEFSRIFDYPDFKSSEGWLEKFKHRHSVVCKAISGEEATVNPDVKSVWITQSLPHLLEGYSAEKKRNYYF